MSRARVLSGLLLLILMACQGCSPTGSARPNIVLIVLDTVRADRLRCRSDDRVPMPRIAELCARGVYFEQVSSSSSWTLPAHASLFTGLYPIRHGATQESAGLDERAPTLAERLGESGYRTYAASANPLVSIKSGLARGFDSFEETWRGQKRTGPVRPSDHRNLRAVDELLMYRDRGSPFFLFANFIEAHAPNKPPEHFRPASVRERAGSGEIDHVGRHTAARYYLAPESVPANDFALLSELYDGEIAQLDELVGALVDRLDADGALSNSILILTSDHGENFGEHGHFRHIFSLYRSNVHIPLLVVLPGNAHAGERRADPVALVDLFATILGMAGVELPGAGGDGRDLFAAAPAVDAEHPVVSEYYFPAQALSLFGPDLHAPQRDRLDPFLRRLRSIESDGLRLIWSSDGNHELYDLATDPTEERNLAGDPRYAERERALLERLDAFVADAGGPRPLPDMTDHLSEPGGAFGDLDRETAEQLRELGYLPR